MTTPPVEKSDPRRNTRAEVLRLTREGFRPFQIEKALNISKSRVFQHLRDLRRKGELR